MSGGAGLSGLIFLFGLLFGGGDSLSEYLNPELYWKSRDVAFEAAAMAEVLNPVTGTDEAQITKWVEQLGADSFRDRAAASAALRTVGLPAQPYLLPASRSQDPEVAQRAKILLKEMEKDGHKEDPVDLWMALYSLSVMEDPEAEGVLKEVAVYGQGEWKKEAAAFLNKSESGGADAANTAVLSSFPADTCLVLQADPPGENERVRDFIRQSPLLQDELAQLLSETGDVVFHRITVGVNTLSPRQESAQLTVLLEMSYQPEKVSAYLEKMKFLKKADRNHTVLQRNHSRIYPLSGRKLLLTLQASETEAMNAADLDRLSEGKAHPEFPGAIQQSFSALPAASLVRGVGTFTADRLEEMDELKNIRTVSGRMGKETELFAMNLNLGFRDAAAAESFEKALRGLLDDLRGELAREGEEAAALVALIDSVALEREDAGLALSGSVRPDALLIVFTQIEKDFQRIQDRRNRNSNRINRAQQIQIQQLQGRGIIAF